MICKKCNGRGYAYKPCAHIDHDTQDCWVHGCNDPKTCRACHGYGITGHEVVRQILKELVATSRDCNSIKLGNLALKEWEPSICNPIQVPDICHDDPYEIHKQIMTEC